MDGDRAEELRQAHSVSDAKLIENLAGRGRTLERDIDRLLLAPLIREGDGAGDTGLDLCRRRRTRVVGRILEGAVAHAVGRAGRSQITWLAAGWTCGPIDDRPARRQGAFG